MQRLFLTAEQDLSPDQQHGEPILRLREIVVSAFIAILLSAPFLDKPFHVDDTVVLHVVSRILVNPADPLSGDLDWFGSSLPTWQVTTNPPFLSYYLAPFALLSDYSEITLHWAMIPFTVALMLGSLMLAARFHASPWIAALFLVTSPGIWVSANIMRDVPALGLATLGLALGIAGVDRGSFRLTSWGSTLAGLSILTKYSAAIVLPLLVLYMILQKRFQLLAWLSPALLLVSLWCLQTRYFYGIAHPVFLLLGDHPGGSLGLADKSWAALVALGSISLLGLLVGANVLVRLNWRLLLFYGGGGLAVALGASVFQEKADFQYLFWALMGVTAILSGILGATWPFRPRNHWLVFRSADETFLLAWFLAPIVFSLLFVPFQAVRHLIPAILPLGLLVLRRRERLVKPLTREVFPALVLPVLVLQVALGLAVGLADQEYARCYRDFASHGASKWISEKQQTWYVGHWGWKFYADRAGLTQLHGEGSDPGEDDILLWPQRVHIGNVFSGHPGLKERLKKVDEYECTTSLPIRTMNFEGAAFYAVVRGNLPYRLQRVFLERLNVYQVGPPPRTP